MTINEVKKLVEAAGGKVKQVEDYQFNGEKQFAVKLENGTTMTLAQKQIKDEAELKQFIKVAQPKKPTKTA